METASRGLYNARLSTISTTTEEYEEMREYTLDEIKLYIVHHFDPEDLIEVLELNTQKLLDAFEDDVLANIQKFSAILDDDEEVTELGED